MSAVAMIPYLGDLAKLGKLGRYPKQLAKAIALALKSGKFAKALAPVLSQLKKLLERIPLEKLPKRLREPLESLKNQLDNFSLMPQLVSPGCVTRNLEVSLRTLQNQAAQ
jgi:hypothetical protein